MAPRDAVSHRVPARFGTWRLLQRNSAENLSQSSVEHGLDQGDRTTAPRGGDPRQDIGISGGGVATPQHLRFLLVGGVLTPQHKREQPRGGVVAVKWRLLSLHFAIDFHRRTNDPKNAKNSRRSDAIPRDVDFATKTHMAAPISSENFALLWLFLGAVPRRGGADPPRLALPSRRGGA